MGIKKKRLERIRVFSYLYFIIKTFEVVIYARNPRTHKTFLYT